MSNNFIGIYPEVFSKEYCDACINWHTQMVEAGYSRTRQQEGHSKLKKDDTSTFFSAESSISMNGTRVLADEFLKGLWEKGYNDYAATYPVLADLDKHGVFSTKLQHTKIGGGYHVWHCETGNKATAGRILTYTLYLNDVEEGGETEFLYYPLRVKPKAGTVLIFPAGFTHTHRGNPPISNDKYIITGWVEF